MTRRRGPTGSARIGVSGLGYMGLATALSFSAHGGSVIGYDVNREVTDRIAHGRSPYHEAGLESLLSRELSSGRFRVVGDLAEMVAETEGVFLCLPTPAGARGRIDLRPVTSGARQLGKALRRTEGHRTVVIKSTVVPGTTERVLEPELRRVSGLGTDRLGVAANPEFLAEGSMVRDALRPERIVLGVNDPRSRGWLRRVYRSFGAPVLELSPTGAELVKYASNAFLALKVSFANEISRMAERLGTHVDDVMAATGADPRIGSKFLRAGPGFGGSCFEKDLRALVTCARDLGVRLRTGETTLTVNAEQTHHALELARQAAGPLHDRTVAVLGLSFKPGTDDVRESRAFPLVTGLLKDGARARVHDPVALGRFREAWKLGHPGGPGNGESLVFASSVPSALEGADLAILHTDWPEYRAWPRSWTDRMRQGVVLDLRRSLPASVTTRARLKVVALGVGNGSMPNGGPAGPPGSRRP